MRLPATTLLTLFPALSLAQQPPQAQKPLAAVTDTFNSLLSAAKPYLPASLSASLFPPILDAGAAKIAAKNVVPLTADNWKTTIIPGASSSNVGSDKWMVLISGGNKTCGGRCAGVETAWNESAALFSADPTAPQLGYVNCDTEPLLCNIWFAGPAAVWYIEPSAAGGKTDVHIVVLNTTTATAQDIVKIHTKQTYKDVPLNEGYFHPWDGLAAQLGVNVAIGWAVRVIGMIPSWTFMVLISFFSRSIMSRRTGNPNVAAQGTVPQGGAPPASG